MRAENYDDSVELFTPCNVRFSCLKPGPAQSQRPSLCEGQFWLMNDDNLVCGIEDDATLTLLAFLSLPVLHLYFAVSKSGRRSSS